MKRLLLVLVLALAMVTIVHAQTAPALSVSVLSQEPDPAQAGGTADVVFRINNGGGPADNVQLQLVDSYPFTVVGDAVQSLGTVGEYQTGIRYTVRIDKDALDGDQTIKLRYRYSGTDWSEAAFTVRVANKQSAQIMIDKAQLEPGQETNVTFTVTNTGASALQNIVFSWNDPKNAILPVYSDNTKYISYLDVGQQVKLTYTVVADVNADPGLYYLDLSLGYQSTTNATAGKIATRAGMLVGGETDFTVTFSESSAGQTSLSVANIGNNPALSVAVSVPEQRQYRVSGSTSSIVGNLDKGDYTIVTFPIVAAGAANGTASTTGAQRNFSGRAGNFSGNFSGGQSGQNQPLQVLIDYTDTTGQRHSVEKNVTIQFRGAAVTGAQSQRQSSSFWTNPVFLAVIALIVIAAGSYYLRKRRKH